MVEIGDGFRLPELFTSTGARIREVGTTNRTRLADYEVDDRTGCVLKVHPSNFTISGFTSSATVAELATLGAPVVVDVGSGLLDPDPLLPDEPDVGSALRAGADVVTCSGDKLLGGPQAGLLVGTAKAVDAARRHPLARALRLDKLSLAALEATLRLYLDPESARREIPVLRMLDEDPGPRARRLAGAIGPAAGVVESVAKVGGGALPLLELPGPVVALAGSPERLAARLRAGEPPVLGRIEDGRLLLDPRTLGDDEVDLVAAAVRAALA
jgi:L-seryl-tRNA(Ser) seleniumtransferase